MIKKLSLALIVAGSIVGCSMTPTYQRPEAPVASTFPETGNKFSANKATDIAWRDFFKDPRLQALIATALEHNRDLRVAALRVQEARLMYNIQSADRIPNLNVAAAGARGRTPADLSGTSPPASVIGSRYDVGLTLASFELDFFGRVKSLSDAALAAYLASEEAQRSVQITLVSEVAKAYLVERANAEQLELAQKSYESRKKSVELAKLRFDVGATSAIDLAQYESLMQTAKASMANNARQRALAESALVLLTGKPLDKLPAPQALSAQNILTDIPPGLPSDLLTNRPDIRQAEQRLLAANANIGAARAAFFPRITLTGSYGTASSDFSNLFQPGTGAWAFAPQLVMPIFDAGRNVNTLDLAWARKNIAVAEYEKTIQIAFRDVADALTARDLLDQQVEALASVKAAEAQRFMLADARYQNGIASSLELFDSERQLFLAEQLLVTAQLLRLTNAIDLYRSLGGGLKSESQPVADASTDQQTPQQQSTLSPSSDLSAIKK